MASYTMTTQRQTAHSLISDKDVQSLLLYQDSL